MIVSIFSIISLCSLVLGLFTYRTNPKEPLYKWFGIFGLITGLWIFSNVLIGIFPTRFWIDLVYTFGALIPASAIMWVSYFCGKKPSRRFKVMLSVIATFFVFLPHLSTKLFLVDIKRIYYGGVESTFGVGFYLYIIYQLSFLAFIAYRLIRYYINAKDIQKTQAKFVMVGDLIWTAIVSTVSFILPLFGVYQFTPFDSPSTIIFLVLTMYAITKHHLFDLKVIASELFVSALWIALFTTTTASQNIQDFFVNGTIFIISVVFGTLLIRSVLEEVKQKEKIEKLAKEIERAYEVEKRANEELKNLDRVKNQFLVQTQHDLRTPLSVIRGYCDLLISGTLGKQSLKTIDVAKRIQIVAEEKIRDVNNFLDTTQFQLGKKVVALKPGVDLNQIIDEVFNHLEPNAKSKGIYLKLEKPEGALLIEADKEKLKSSLFNVIDNSIKYTPNGGVTINVKTENNKIRIEIKDTGIGIPAEKLKTLFDTAFERGDQAKKTFVAGFGVGLYLSSQIVKAHNGKIWVESEGEGKGSVFFVELPASSA